MAYLPLLFEWRCWQLSVFISEIAFNFLENGFFQTHLSIPKTASQFLENALVKKDAKSPVEACRFVGFSMCCNIMTNIVRLSLIGLYVRAYAS